MQTPKVVDLGKVEIPEINLFEVTPVSELIESIKNTVRLYGKFLPKRALRSRINQLANDVSTTELVVTEIVNEVSSPVGNDTTREYLKFVEQNANSIRFKIKSAYLVSTGLLVIRASAVGVLAFYGYPIYSVIAISGEVSGLVTEISKKQARGYITWSELFSDIGKTATKIVIQLYLFPFISQYGSILGQWLAGVPPEKLGEAIKLATSLKPEQSVSKTLLTSIGTGISGMIAEKVSDQIFTKVDKIRIGNYIANLSKEDQKNLLFSAMLSNSIEHQEFTSTFWQIVTYFGTDPSFQARSKKSFDLWSENLQTLNVQTASQLVYFDGSIDALIHYAETKVNSAEEKSKNNVRWWFLQIIHKAAVMQALLSTIATFFGTASLLGEKGMLQLLLANDPNASVKATYAYASDLIFRNEFCLKILSNVLFYLIVYAAKTSVHKIYTQAFGYVSKRTKTPEKIMEKIMALKNKNAFFRALFKIGEVLFPLGVSSSELLLQTIFTSGITGFAPQDVKAYHEMVLNEVYSLGAINYKGGSKLVFKADQQWLQDYQSKKNKAAMAIEKTNLSNLEKVSNDSGLLHEDFFVKDKESAAVVQELSQVKIDAGPWTLQNLLGTFDTQGEKAKNQSIQDVIKQQLSIVKAVFKRMNVEEYKKELERNIIEFNYVSDGLKFGFQETLEKGDFTALEAYYANSVKTESNAAQQQAEFKKDFEDFQKRPWIDWFPSAKVVKSVDEREKRIERYGYNISAFREKFVSGSASSYEAYDRFLGKLEDMFGKAETQISTYKYRIEILQAKIQNIENAQKALVEFSSFQTERYLQRLADQAGLPPPPTFGFTEQDLDAQSQLIDLYSRLANLNDPTIQKEIADLAKNIQSQNPGKDLTTDFILEYHKIELLDDLRDLSQVFENMGTTNGLLTMQEASDTSVEDGEKNREIMFKQLGSVLIAKRMIAAQMTIWQGKGLSEEEINKNASIMFAMLMNPDAFRELGFQDPFLNVLDGTSGELISDKLDQMFSKEFSEKFAVVVTKWDAFTMNQENKPKLDEQFSNPLKNAINQFFGDPQKTIKALEAQAETNKKLIASFESNLKSNNGIYSKDLTFLRNTNLSFRQYRQQMEGDSVTPFAENIFRNVQKEILGENPSTQTKELFISWLKRLPEQVQKEIAGIVNTSSSQIKVLMYDKQRKYIVKALAAKWNNDEAKLNAVLLNNRWKLGQVFKPIAVSAIETASKSLQEKNIPLEVNQSFWARRMRNIVDLYAEGPQKWMFGIDIRDYLRRSDTFREVLLTEQERYYSELELTRYESFLTYANEEIQTGAEAKDDRTFNIDQIVWDLVDSEDNVKALQTIEKNPEWNPKTDDYTNFEIKNMMENTPEHFSTLLIWGGSEKVPKFVTEYKKSITWLYREDGKTPLDKGRKEYLEYVHKYIFPKDAKVLQQFIPKTLSKTLEDEVGRYIGITSNIFGDVGLITDSPMKERGKPFNMFAVKESFEIHPEDLPETSNVPRAVRTFERTHLPVLTNIYKTVAINQLTVQIKYAKSSEVLAEVGAKNQTFPSQQAKDSYAALKQANNTMKEVLNTNGVVQIVIPAGTESNLQFETKALNAVTSGTTFLAEYNTSKVDQSSPLDPDFDLSYDQNNNPILTIEQRLGESNEDFRNRVYSSTKQTVAEISHLKRPVEMYPNLTKYLNDQKISSINPSEALKATCPVESVLVDYYYTQQDDNGQTFVFMDRYQATAGPTTTVQQVIENLRKAKPTSERVDFKGITMHKSLETLVSGSEAVFKNFTISDPQSWSQVIGTLTEKIAQTLSFISTQVVTVKRDIESIPNILPTFESISTAMEYIVKQTTGLQGNLNLVTAVIDPVKKSLEELATKIANSTEADLNTPAFKSLLQNAEDAVKTAQQELKKLAPKSENLNALQDAIDSAAKEIKFLPRYIAETKSFSITLQEQYLEMLSQRVSSVVSSLPTTIQTAKQSLTAFESILKDASKVNATAMQTQEETLQYILRILKSIVNGLEKGSDQLPSIESIQRFFMEIPNILLTFNNSFQSLSAPVSKTPTIAGQTNSITMNAIPKEDSVHSYWTRFQKIETSTSKGITNQQFQQFGNIAELQKINQETNKTVTQALAMDRTIVNPVLTLSVQSAKGMIEKSSLPQTNAQPADLVQGNLIPLVSARSEMDYEKITPLNDWDFAFTFGKTPLKIPEASSLLTLGSKNAYIVFQNPIETAQEESRLQFAKATEAFAVMLNNRLLNLLANPDNEEVKEFLKKGGTMSIIRVPSDKQDPEIKGTTDTQYAIELTFPKELQGEDLIKTQRFVNSVRAFIANKMEKEEEFKFEFVKNPTPEFKNVYLNPQNLKGTAIMDQLKKTTGYTEIQLFTIFFHDKGIRSAMQDPDQLISTFSTPNGLRDFTLRMKTSVFRPEMIQLYEDGKMTPKTLAENNPWIYAKISDKELEKPWFQTPENSTPTKYLKSSRRIPYQLAQGSNQPINVENYGVFTYNYGTMSIFDKAMYTDSSAPEEKSKQDWNNQSVRMDQSIPSSISTIGQSIFDSLKFGMASV